MSMRVQLDGVHTHSSLPSHTHLLKVSTVSYAGKVRTVLEGVRTVDTVARTRGL